MSKQGLKDLYAHIFCHNKFISTTTKLIHTGTLKHNKHLFSTIWVYNGGLNKKNKGVILEIKAKNHVR
jgi:hypothetical protein